MIEGFVSNLLKAVTRTSSSFGSHREDRPSTSTDREHRYVSYHDFIWYLTQQRAMVERTNTPMSVLVFEFQWQGQRGPDAGWTRSFIDRLLRYLRLTDICTYDSRTLYVLLRNADPHAAAVVAGRVSTMIVDAVGDDATVKLGTVTVPSTDSGSDYVDSDDIMEILSGVRAQRTSPRIEVRAGRKSESHEEH